MASVPLPLRERLGQLLVDVDGSGGDGVTRLSALAWTVSDRVTGEGTRSEALDLLAADALMTYACEYAAEVAPERLSELR